MTHTEVDFEERAALLRVLNVDIASKLQPSEIDKHASTYASGLDACASAGLITDEQYRDSFDVIARIVSWSASELEKTDNTKTLAELDLARSTRHADIDEFACDFLGSFSDASIERDLQGTLRSAAYVQCRKDQSFYFVQVNRDMTEDEKIRYQLTVQELNDDNAFEVLNGFASGSKELLDTLTRHEFGDKVTPKILGDLAAGAAMG